MQFCAGCHGKLRLLGKFKPDGTPVVKRAPSAYSLFVKENFADMRSQLPPRTPNSVVMKQLSVQWKSARWRFRAGPGP